MFTGTTASETMVDGIDMKKRLPQLLAISFSYHGICNVITLVAILSVNS